jgi:hypothetical protein
MLEMRLSVWQSFFFILNREPQWTCITALLSGRNEGQGMASLAVRSPMVAVYEVATAMKIFTDAMLDQSA